MARGGAKPNRVDTKEVLCCTRPMYHLIVYVSSTVPTLSSVIELGIRYPRKKERKKGRKKDSPDSFSGPKQLIGCSPLT